MTRPIDAGDPEFERVRKHLETIMGHQAYRLQGLSEDCLDLVNLCNAPNDTMILSLFMALCFCTNKTKQPEVYRAVLAKLMESHKS